MLDRARGHFHGFGCRRSRHVGWDLKSLAFRRLLPVRSGDGALPTDRPYPQFFGAGRPRAAEADLGAQGHLRHGPAPGRVLPQDPDRLIPVAVHHVPLLGGEGQEGQHLTAGEAGDERLLGIDAPGVAPITGGASARTVTPPSKVQSWSRLYVSEVNSAVSRFHATVTVCSDMASPPDETIGPPRSRPDYPRLPAGGPMIPSGEGSGACRSRLVAEGMAELPGHSVQLVLQRYVELIRLPQVVIYRMVRFI